MPTLIRVVIVADGRCAVDGFHFGLKPLELYMDERVIKVRSIIPFKHSLLFYNSISSYRIVKVKDSI